MCCCRLCCRGCRPRWICGSDINQFKHLCLQVPCAQQRITSKGSAQGTKCEDPATLRTYPTAPCALQCSRRIIQVLKGPGERVEKVVPCSTPWREELVLHKWVCKQSPAEAHKRDAREQFQPFPQHRPSFKQRNSHTRCGLFLYSVAKQYSQLRTLMHRAKMRKGQLLRNSSRSTLTQPSASGQGNRGTSTPSAPPTDAAAAACPACPCPAAGPASGKLAGACVSMVSWVCCCCNSSCCYKRCYCTRGSG